MGGRKHFVDFGSLGILSLSVGEGLGRKSHLGPAEMASSCSCFFRKLVGLNPKASSKYLAIQPSLATA